MAITIDGFTLSPHMLWVDEQDYKRVEQQEIRTLGGRMKVYSQGLEKGRPITLVAVQDQGWLTKTQVEKLHELAAVPGAIYALVVGTQSFNVIFRHSEGAPFKADALISRIESQAGDMYTCTINLLTV